MSVPEGAERGLLTCKFLLMTVLSLPTRDALVSLKHGERTRLASVVWRLERLPRLWSDYRSPMRSSMISVPWSAGDQQARLRAKTHGKFGDQRSLSWPFAGLHDVESRPVTAV